RRHRREPQFASSRTWTPQPRRTTANCSENRTPPAHQLTYNLRDYDGHEFAVQIVRVGELCSAERGDWPPLSRSNRIEACPYERGARSRPARATGCLRRKASRCAASRNASVPPARVTESAPTILAYWRQSAGLAPRMNWRMNPASKLSPAPTTSTEVTGGGKPSNFSAPRRA